MRKVLLCNLRMNNDATPVTYRSEAEFFPVADTEVRYPVTAFYEKTLKPDDEVEVIILAKENARGQWENNIDTCKSEFAAVAQKTGATLHVDVIVTPFKENREVHGDLLLQIIQKVGKKAAITVDMTYGPKDQVIILFSALNFLERFCDCRIDNIIYGKVNVFDEKNRPVDSSICEMAPLYYISKLMNEVRVQNPDRAMKMLQMLLDE